MEISFLNLTLPLRLTLKLEKKIFVLADGILAQCVLFHNMRARSYQNMENMIEDKL